MFASVAHRYDLLNHLLSLSVDRWWRRVTRSRLRPLLPDRALILDLCTGTGDLALELSAVARVVGCDFCRPMLVRAAAKESRSRRPHHAVTFVEGDALVLPFADNRFDAVTIAFGLRNLEHYESGLREMLRVLRPGGCLAILEFSLPTLPIVRPLYLLYFTRVLPALGRLISGREGPYSYLPQSVREFPDPPQLARLLRGVGFTDPSESPLTMGIATLSMARKEKPAVEGNFFDTRLS